MNTAPAAADPDCIIVGAGLAGLACARTLVQAGRRVLLVESADRVGGRVATDSVATDSVDGFRIDRGFQVYNDAYPEGRRQLDLAALDLGRFEPGALVADRGRLRRVADPWRRPLSALGGFLDGSVGLADGLRTARLRAAAVRALRAGTLDPDAPVTGDDRTTRAELEARGFSRAFVERFFVPFFGGVFLERALDTASTVFLFDFAMFALGTACLPRGGMEAIPRQLAAGLPVSAVRCGCSVRSVETGQGGEPGRVVLADGSRLTARSVVVATDVQAAGRLLPESLRGPWADRRWSGTRLVAFAAERSPLGSPTLVVSSEPDGPIDNLTVPSDVAAGYAPPGASLVTVSVRGCWKTTDDELGAAIRDQAGRWFGRAVHGWRPLATVHVPAALPRETPADRARRQTGPSLAPGLFLCGDHCSSASINGALVSGRRCAEAVLR
jgi:phytoene dehydrogenase-like protein